MMHIVAVGYQRRKLAGSADRGMAAIPRSRGVDCFRLAHLEMPGSSASQDLLTKDQAQLFSERVRKADRTRKPRGDIHR